MYVSVITTAPSAAATPEPVAFANANSCVSLLGIRVALYASVPSALTCWIGSAGLMLICAPPIGRFTFSGSTTTT